MYFRQQEASHQDHVGKHFYKRIRQWSEIENQVLSPRTAEDEEQYRSRTRAVQIDYGKTAHHATSSSPLGATTHTESRNADAESCRKGSICQNGGTLLH